MRENRREFFRVEFEPLKEGEVSIQEGAFFPVKIENISAGGMGFISAAKILMHEKVECRFTILDTSFLIKGFIVRKVVHMNYAEYGVKFAMNQKTASALFRQLNYYQIRQRKGKR
ncbi:PilZ domain-containing protein [Bacillus sp. FJAT-27251]|uniref:PilZ domain-containing protein n=1 Tax=Bacillus sp. FJAT-27251 TaxID=1684142 RepID=UPI0006A7C2C6|nr:PilZ domain-containing protein [Bacillus sp. FJAT-27251]